MGNTLKNLNKSDIVQWNSDVTSTCEDNNNKTHKTVFCPDKMDKTLKNLNKSDVVQWNSSDMILNSTINENQTSQIK